MASNDRRRPRISNRHGRCEFHPANWESAMGEVMIKCPDTGRDIPTGMIADRISFSAMPVFFARVLCPVCHTQHEWFAREAWVCEADPQPTRALSYDRSFRVRDRATY